MATTKVAICIDFELTTWSDIISLTVYILVNICVPFFNNVKLTTVTFVYIYIN